MCPISVLFTLLLASLSHASQLSSSSIGDFTITLPLHRAHGKGTWYEYPRWKEVDEAFSSSIVSVDGFICIWSGCTPPTDICAPFAMFTNPSDVAGTVGYFTIVYILSCFKEDYSNAFQWFAQGMKGVIYGAINVPWLTSCGYSGGATDSSFPAGMYYFVDGPHNPLPNDVQGIPSSVHQAVADKYAGNDTLTITWALGDDPMGDGAFVQSIRAPGMTALNVIYFLCLWALLGKSIHIIKKMGVNRWSYSHSVVLMEGVFANIIRIIQAPFQPCNQFSGSIASTAPYTWKFFTWIERVDQPMSIGSSVLASMIFLKIVLNVKGNPLPLKIVMVGAPALMTIALYVVLILYSLSLDLFDVVGGGGAWRAVQEMIIWLFAGLQITAFAIFAIASIVLVIKLVMVGKQQAKVLETAVRMLRWVILQLIAMFFSILSNIVFPEAQADQTNYKNSTFIYGLMVLSYIPFFFLSVFQVMQFDPKESSSSSTSSTSSASTTNNNTNTKNKKKKN